MYCVKLWSAGQVNNEQHTSNRSNKATQLFAFQKWQPRQKCRQAYALQVHSCMKQHSQPASWTGLMAPEYCTTGMHEQVSTHPFQDIIAKSKGSVLIALSLHKHVACSAALTAPPASVQISTDLQSFELDAFTLHLTCCCSDVHSLFLQRKSRACFLAKADTCTCTVHHTTSQAALRRSADMRLHTAKGFVTHHVWRQTASVSSSSAFGKHEVHVRLLIAVACAIASALGPVLR